uniref:Uncharacterized protein n=1 Tax=Alexandrium monilatum TaxID=311494 RepID=A0A7S4QKM5_9DINO|mmetsp:Transcript_88887/g.278437  ORF Transcript_88887/g.278437 Transcript_88887/m.278437 type:complete len:222 (-) Transcript_88887:6-671(-)
MAVDELSSAVSSVTVGTAEEHGVLTAVPSKGSRGAVSSAKGAGRARRHCPLRWEAPRSSPPVRLADPSGWGSGLRRPSEASQHLLTPQEAATAAAAATATAGTKTCGSLRRRMLNKAGVMVVVVVVEMVVVVVLVVVPVVVVVLVVVSVVVVVVLVMVVVVVVVVVMVVVDTVVVDVLVVLLELAAERDRPAATLALPVGTVSVCDEDLVRSSWLARCGDA